MENTNAEPQFKRVSAGGEGGGAITFIRPSELSEAGTTGEIVRGVYAGTVENSLTGKQDFKFQLSNGDIAVLNSAGNLPSRMSQVEVGTLTRVLYNGKQKISKGKYAGKMAHNFEVETA